MLVAEEVADDDVGVVGGDGFVGLQARVKVVVLVGRNVTREVDLQCAGHGVRPAEGAMKGGK